MRNVQITFKKLQIIFQNQLKRMSKKGFQQLNINPISISAISNNPDVSSASFTGIFQQKKTKEDQSQYKIKVKKPYDIGNRNFNQVISPNKSNGQNDQQFQLSELEQGDPKIQAEQIALRQDLTGYQICKTSFSEQQIIEAFKVIDINKDQVITEEDIIFFLEYIKQPYTKQQVKQMIEMVSSDKKKVTFQDFKKIGKGSIIPFADIKIPDEETKQKKVIYQNIKKNKSLYDQNPSILINAQKNDIISLKKFEQSKKISKIAQFQSIKLIDQEEELDFLMEKINLLSEQEFLVRKNQFNSIQMVNVTQVIKNYHQVCNYLSNEQTKYFNYKQISRLLQISQKQAKILYGSKKSTLGKKVVLETIAFSPLNKIKRLELGMLMMLKKKTINFSELYFLMQILKGKDISHSLKKKLLTVLKSKNIEADTQMDKFYVLQLIGNYSFNFNF